MRRHSHAPLPSVLLSLALGLSLSACGGGGGGGSDTLAPPILSSSMAVTPEAPYMGLGSEGGLAVPYRMDFVVKNVGDAPLAWSAESTEAWAVLSLQGGLLEPQQEAVVSMLIKQTAVQRLPIGILTGSIDFVNLDNDVGSASRGLTLTISKASQPRLTLTPAQDFDSTGLVGGPFVPADKSYRLKNDGSQPLSWFVQASGPGLSFDQQAGTLAPGTRQDVQISLNQGAAAKLPIGDHQLLVTFFTQGDLAPPVSRKVTVHVQPAGPGTTSTSLSQFGITWTFDKAYEVGQFANKDWWVKGPVELLSISPASVSSNDRQENGSMLNPSAVTGISQGYDSSAYAQYSGAGSYRPGLNVALDVSPSSPLSLAPDSSLVSTVSLPAPGLRPQSSSAAILTVLANAPPAGSFRPSYASRVKSTLFNESDLDYSKLSRLKAVSSAPRMLEVQRQFRRPWIDHTPIWVGRYLHPSENMPDYGREIVEQIGSATLMLNLDFSDAQKRDLLVSVVQLGIDLHGIFEREGKSTWRPFGGHMSGRKWPILFAGLMLDDPSMMSVGLDPEAEFSEDGQSFYVAETSPGVYNFGEGGYGQGDVGLPEWGSYHSTRPSYDNKNWFGDPYRLCCTANAWWGQLLSAHIMGARQLWNHEPLFDYQDRFLLENRSRGINDFRLSWTGFPMDMWNAYRGQY